jgi:transcriptional regulator with XRE-family HTH domain
MDQLEKLGKRLTALRCERNLTQAELAEILGVSRAGYASYEQGRRRPPFECIVKMAHFFVVSTDYLIGPPLHEAQWVSTEDERLNKLLYTWHHLSKRKKDQLMRVVEAMYPVSVNGDLDDSNFVAPSAESTCSIRRVRKKALAK